jgi:hypothetical protein
MVRGEGLEPPAHGISARRSAAELPAHADRRWGDRRAVDPACTRVTAWRLSSRPQPPRLTIRALNDVVGAATGTRTPDLLLEGQVAWPARLPRHDGCGGRSCTGRRVAYETSRLLSAAMMTMVGPAGFEPASTSLKARDPGR